MAKKSKRSQARGSSHYRKVQHALSEYTRANGVKLGKDFNKVASAIHKANPKTPVKFISQNIEQLFKLHGAGAVGKIKIPVEFPVTDPGVERVAFYNFKDELSRPQYDGVKVTISMAENMAEGIDAAAEGTAEEVSDYYSANIHAYMRKYYNESPVGVFKLIDTDNKTFVEYQFEPGEGVAKTPPVPEQPKEPAPELPPSDEPKSETDKQIELMKLQKELELEKQKTLDKQIELEKLKGSRAAQAMELKNAGFSVADIKILLGL